MNMDGLFGLGFASLSDNVPTLMDSLKSSGAISKKVFALYMNSFSSATYPLHGYPSSNLMIGGYDLATYSTTGSIEMTVPVDNSGFWEATMTSFSIHGVVVQTSPVVIFDSGTTAISFETSLLDSVFSTFTASSVNSCSTANDGSLVCTCSKTSDLMALTLEYGGKKLVFNAERLWTMQAGKCTLNIDAQTDPGMLLGDYFLSSYYVIHDMDNMQISFAPAVTASTTAPKSWAEMIMLAVGISMII
jgi:hypothetical protein